MLRPTLLTLGLICAGVINLHSLPQDAGSHGGVVTMRGCLEQGGDANTYKLATVGTDGSHTYPLNGDPNQLSEHVGHEVKVTGKLQNADAMNASKKGSIDVTSIKRLSGTCGKKSTP